MSASATEQRKNNSEPQDFADKSKEKKKKLIVGGTILGAAAIGAGIVFGGGSDSGEKVPIEHSIPTISGDENGDGYLNRSELQNMTPEAVADVAKVDPKLLLPVYGADFDKYRKDTNTLLNSNGYFLNVDPDLNYVPTGSKSEYGDLDILVQVALDHVDASVQSDENNPNVADPEESKRAMALIESPGQNDYENAIRYIDEHRSKRPDIGLFLPAGESYDIHASTFNGVDLSPYTKVKLIKQRSVPSNGDSSRPYVDYGLYGLVEDGQYSVWRNAGRWGNDDGLNTELASLRAAEAANNQPS